ncbi:hypothetical protein KKH65_04145, partial [bacterium]|nr:hypothetical protein [bacterium]
PILDPNQPELPPTPGTIATTRIYCWWGNPDYIISRSNKKETFDLWEDWEDRDLDTVAGCPDNTSDCSGKPADLTGWRNLPTPANNYNWWRIRNRLDGKAIMADKGGSFGSDDIGPFVVGGDIRWSNYEVIYTFYDEYCNYSDCGQVWGNPQYNPVCHYDPGNTWGMEYFANMFIFRPYGDGTDWTWQYQSYPKDILGESFPAKNKRYWIKVRPFYRPDNGNTHLSLLVAKATPTDEDLDTGYKHITENEAANPPGFIAPLAYASQGGAIGFGGWNGGFSYDNIRVRKFVYPEPTVEIGSPQTLAYRPIKTLSFPNITQPLMDRRRCLVIGSIEPWIWRGNLYAYYADCYLSGDCKEGESTSTLGSISLWGSETSGKEKGFGDHLKEAIVGTNNLSYDSIKNEPLDWKKRERHIFTAGTTTPPPLAVNGGFINFDYNNREQLKPFLNVPGEELIDLINFVRGRYVQRYSRSKLRMTDGSTADNCQWKLGDIVHSNPLIVGLPTMYYPDTDYESFRKQNGSRTLVAYFGSNEGMIHCVRMAKYEKDNLTGKSKYKSDFTARELWTFIPQGLLGKLKETTDTEHEYTADGLLRAIDIWDNIEGKYKTVLVGVLRTGGSSIFAIDITDPYQPKLLWEKNKDSAGYETFFQNIGETFSSPALGMLDKGLGPKNNPWVGIFGSGLDPIDVNNIFTKKAYLTIINLKDGSIIENKQFKVSDKIGNITSNIECIIDKFGKIIRISFGDYFGGLFRVDLSTSSKVATFLSKVSLSDYLFFEPSDYSTSNMWTGTPPKWPVPTEPVFGTIKSKEEKFYIYLPTGDYDSYDSNYPHQRVYCLDETTIPSPYSYYKGTSTLIDMTNSSNTNPDEKSYFIELGHSDIKDYATTGAISSKDRNERCLSPVEVFGGVLFFTTFTPSPSACEGGNTRFYATHFASGKYYDNLIKQVPGKEDVRSVSYLNVGVPSSPMTYLGRGSEGEKLAAGIMNTGSADILQVSLNPSIFPAVNILLWRELR